MLELGQINETAVTTLGLEKDNSRLKPKTGHEFGNQLLPHLEDELYDKCLSVLCLVDPEVDPSSSRRTLHPQIIRLSDKISDLVLKQDSLKKEKMELCSTWNKSFQTQCQVSGQVGEKLSTLVNTHICSTKAKNNLITVKYLCAKCEALGLKLKCIESEILNATYTRESITALKKIRARLLEITEDTQNKISKVKTTLDQYYQCGPEFSELVKEYARLQKEIEGKNWALSELRN